MHQPLNTSTIHPLAMKPFTLIIFFALLTAYGSYIISPPSASLSLPPPSTVAYESCKRSYALERQAQECLTPHWWKSHQPKFWIANLSVLQDLNFSFLLKDKIFYCLSYKIIYKHEVGEVSCMHARTFLKKFIPTYQAKAKCHSLTNIIWTVL